MSDPIDPAAAIAEFDEKFAEAQAAETAKQSEPVADALGELLQRWVGECIHNSPIAQTTEAYNHLVTVALPELKRRLAAI